MDSIDPSVLASVIGGGVAGFVGCLAALRIRMSPNAPKSTGLHVHRFDTMHGDGKWRCGECGVRK